MKCNICCFCVYMHLCVYGCRPVRPRWWPAGNRKHGSVSEARKHSRNLSQSIVSLIQNDFVPHLRSWKLQVASVPCLSDVYVHCGGVTIAASVHMVLTNENMSQTNPTTTTAGVAVCHKLEGGRCLRPVRSVCVLPRRRRLAVPARIYKDSIIASMHACIACMRACMYRA